MRRDTFATAQADYSSAHISTDRCDALAPSAVDLFCGVGGMSLGFSYAGFDIIGAFDSDPIHVSSYGRNFGSAHIHQADLSMDSERVLDILNLEARQVDVLFGGPPCQGFSVIGRRDSSDARNQLIQTFAAYVHEIRPKYFVMENVPGLVLKHAAGHLEGFIERVQRSGYSVLEPVRMLNAADFGVPQSRERVFVLGWRNGLPQLQYPSASYGQSQGHIHNTPTVRDAIADLPFMPNERYLMDGHRYTRRLKNPHSSYSLGMRSIPPSFAGPISLTAKGLSGCRVTSHSFEVEERFAQVKPGSIERKSRISRLAWNALCPTLRAGTTKDQGSHTAARPIHPQVPRYITAREAARLHSFPDWFEFHDTIWHSHRQIGNAVPPLLAKAVGEAVTTALRMIPRD
jgi:DNA (cytosine-5)-methyltransferase 1